MDKLEVSPLLQAAYQQDWHALEEIRAADGIANIAEAAAAGDVEAAAAFVKLDSGAVARRTADGFTALHLAAYFGHADVVALLLEAGADPNAVADNPTRLRPLHSAVAARDIIAVRFLLDAGADPDVAQSGGYTPLMAAAQHGDDDIVAALLERSADRTMTSDDGRTAADFASGAATADPTQE